MNCLNCNAETNGAFCHNCGQATSTGRFTVQKIFTKVFSYVFVLSEKGILYTIKQLLIRPGKSTREYVQGHRVKITEYFTLIILLLTAGLILDNFSSDIHLNDLGITYSKDINSKTLFIDNFSGEIENIVGNYPKLTILLLIPFMGLSSYLWFRKKSKQNFAENIVLNFYRASGEFIITLVAIAICLFVKDLHFLGIVFNSVLYLSFTYSVWFYYQYHSTFGYRKSALLVRSILTYITGYVFFILLLSIIISLKINFSKS